MSRRFSLAGIALPLLLLLPAHLEAQTWPRDITGTPAAECAALDANGTPQLCGPSNPLPVTGSTALSGGTGTSSAGQNWFLSQPPGFNPFVRLNGTSDTLQPWLFFLDDINLVAFGAGNAPNSTVHRWSSTNGGKSWTAVSQSAALCGGFQLASVLKVPTNNYIFACGGVIANTFFTGDGIQFTSRTATGALPSNVRNNIAQNVATVLVSSPDGTATNNDTICRSANSGTTWNCAIMPAITGWTGGANGFSVANSAQAAQSFAAPSANNWLVAGNSKTTSVGKILRSTDDGLNWTEVFSGGSAIGAVQCLTSTLCLTAAGQQIQRSTDGGASWTTIVTTGPAGANTNWNAVIPFSDTVAVVAPFGAASTPVHFYRTVDGGLTWGDQQSSPCVRNTGVAQPVASVAVRNGRAVVVSNYLSLTTGGPCAHYSSLGTGGTAVTGPLGVAWEIGADGSGPMSQGNPQVPFTVAPTQGLNLFNSQATGAANTAVVVTIAAVADQRAHIDRVEASCSAGTSSLTIVDTSNGVTLWTTLTGEVGVARFRQPFTPKSLTGPTQSTITITLAACGVGNAGTLIVHADRF